jgi:hypothetical protein
MGETTDQLRDQVDQTRDDASRTIQEIEDRVSSATQQVKDQLDWRHQVQQRPLMSVGLAVIGGMVLGGLTGSHDSHAPTNGNGASYGHEHRGGIGDALRGAAKSSGFDDAVHDVANAALGSFGARLRSMAAENFPSLAGGAQASEHQKQSTRAFSGTARSMSATPSQAVP